MEYWITETWENNRTKLTSAKVSHIVTMHIHVSGFHEAKRKERKKK